MDDSLPYCLVEDLVHPGNSQPLPSICPETHMPGLYKVKEDIHTQVQQSRKWEYTVQCSAINTSDIDTVEDILIGLDQGLFGLVFSCHFLYQSEILLGLCKATALKSTHPHTSTPTPTTHTDTHTHIHTNTHRHRHTHTYTQTHTDTDTHTHRHTHNVNILMTCAQHMKMYTYTYVH